MEISFWAYNFTAKRITRSLNIVRKYKTEVSITTDNNIQICAY